jgi:hypothetical protein
MAGSSLLSENFVSGVFIGGVKAGTLVESISISISNDIGD